MVGLELTYGPTTHGASIHKHVNGCPVICMNHVYAIGPRQVCMEPFDVLLEGCGEGNCAIDWASHEGIKHSTDKKPYWRAPLSRVEELAQYYAKVMNVSTRFMAAISDELHNVGQFIFGYCY